MIKEMSIDLETYSDIDISKCGAYKYAESDNFEILLFGVSIDGGETQVFDLACGDTLPDEILEAISDDTVTKWAFNAAFERICLSNWLKKHYPMYFKSYSIPEDPASQYLNPASWKCSMIWSAYMGLPLSLEGVGSVLKLQDQKMNEGKDKRAHGMFQFYGANRSGRWAGRHIQLQNLPQNHLPDLSEARALVRSGNYDAAQLLYDDIPDTLSQLIRTAFVPKEGCKFIVSDFSAIEARVLSYLACEAWRIDVFKNNGDIYCASASEMFHVPVEKHGQNSHLRQKGKIAELALGYGGSVGALKSMGALDMGLQEEELQPLVDMWRSSNPNIVRFWWDVDRAAKTAIKEQTQTAVKGIVFKYQSGMLFIQLPSGRSLTYIKPKIGENKFGGESVTYEGVGATKKWERIESYGPKFVENIVQAISRDILMYAIRTLSHCFIVGHVHDELIIECSPDVSLDAICEQMGRTPDWIQGLILRADGYETEFYKKD